MEDQAEDYDFDYYSLTQEMKRAFSTTGSDIMKVKELMERKQGQPKTFSEYVSNMHNLYFKLKRKIAEDISVELLKDNMKSQMGGLLLTSPLTSLAEFKREGLRVDRWTRNKSNISDKYDLIDRQWDKKMKHQNPDSMRQV